MMSQLKSFYLLNFASMWECFSYYGMRALLVLFMVKELNLTDSQAYATYALYITLIELGGVLGGMLADRFLTLKGAIMIGGWAIFGGHLLLGFSQNSPLLFFSSLGLVVAGTNLFRVNIPAEIGTLYTTEENLRDRAFTIFYTTINIGGLLATIICGILGEGYGWHLGFGAAAVGMLIGNVALIINWKAKEILNVKRIMIGIGYILSATLSISMSLAYAREFIPYVSILLAGAFLLVFQRIYKNKALLNFIQLIGYLILFYACEELLGSSLVLFAERHIDRVVGGFEIPASMVSMVNPLVILLGGSFAANLKINTSYKICLSLFLLGFAFIIFYFAANFISVPLVYVAAAIGLISFGELFIGPTVFAESAKLSKDNERGFTMAIVTLGFSAANLLSGYFSQIMAVEDGNSLLSFQNGFGKIAIVVFITLMFSFIFMRKYANQVNKICQTSA